MLHLVALACVVLLATECGGTTPERPQRLAAQAPRGASGPIDSAAVKAGFVIQNALDAPAAQSTMESYLGNRYAGDWIVNNGKRGVLYIGVVHPTDADQRYAQRNIQMGPHASFRLVREKYSMAQLNRFDAVVSGYVDRQRNTKLLEQHPYVSIGVGTFDNAVDFEVPKEDATFWIRRVQPLVPYDALVIQYGSPVVAD